METKNILERIVDERTFYETALKRAEKEGKKKLATFFEGKVCAFLRVEDMLQEES